ncbi:RNA-binding protein Rsf1 [Drosophila virilis]|uniref:RRM domain-containing protein n=1 Tax=Drosophila virilis TaxID=7244 RepID=B4LR12_DROVI|nr:RNA-binding protein Rsf1 [Drosophila virilis]EDW64551.1 uncharacterized protein Dvir_GJ17527 [Drosophila virilis]
MTDQRGTRVYVGNLTDKVKKDDLEGEFTKYGKLNSVWIAFNPPGFAFVEFEHRDDAEKACDILNGSELLGSQLRVEISKGRPRQGRRGGPGDRGRRSDVGRHSITNSSSSGGFRQQRGSSSSSSRNFDRSYSSGRSSASYGGARDGSTNGFSRRDVYNGARESSRYGGGSSGSSYGRNGGGQGGGRFRSRSPVGNHRF